MRYRMIKEEPVKIYTPSKKPADTEEQTQDKPPIQAVSAESE